MEKKSSPTKLAAEEASVSHGSSVSFSVNMQIAFIFIILQWSVFFCYLILCSIPQLKGHATKKKGGVKVKLHVFYFY